MRTTRTIEQLNADFILEDTQIIWAGAAVLLYPKGQLNNLLASFTATGDVQAKILRWLNKNDYRCTQMHDGKIWL